MACGLQGAGKFYVGSVDCGEDEWIRTLFGLRGYPHFKLCSKERMYPYPTTVSRTSQSRAEQSHAVLKFSAGKGKLLTR